MAQSHWYSKNQDHTSWPVYGRMHPVIAGPSDALIDEVTGIPMTIKMLYGVMTDAEQRAAFSQLFTKEGFGQLVEGLKEEARATLKDEEKITYTTSRAGVSVALMFITGGLSKTGKGLSLLEDLLGNMGQLAKYHKLTAWLDNVKKAMRESPELFKVLKKQFDEVFEKFPMSHEHLDRLVGWAGTNTGFNRLIEQLHRFKDIDGLEKVIQEMASQKGKLVGGKFVLNFAENGLNGQKIKKILKFEAVDFDQAGNRIYDLFFETNTGKLIRAELKNWGDFYPDVIRNQFVKDLNKMTEIGELKWFFNKTSGITDNKVLKEKVLKALRKADGSVVDELDVVSLERVKGLLGNKYGIIREGNKTTKLLEALSDDKIFNQIFEIVE